MSPLRAFLFDLDGVLLDTERLYTSATQAIVGRFGKTFSWDLKRHTMGRDALESAAFLLRALDIPMRPDDFLRERAPILEDLFAGCEAREGARDFVIRSHDAGVPMAVATSTARPLFELKTRHHDFFERFAHVVCGDDARVSAKKPAPDIFLAAASGLGVEPGGCVVFEDSLAGVEAARRAGMRVVALPDPALDVGEFRAADRIAAAFADLDIEELFAAFP